MPLIQLTS